MIGGGHNFMTCKRRSLWQKFIEICQILIIIIIIIIIIINDNFYSALSKSSKALYNQGKKVKNTN